ncbi:MAG: NUDIX hydrolase [Chlamydiota bacterium]
MTKIVEVHETKPEQFNSQVEISACYLEAGDKLLLLQNASTDLEPGTWGVPAGKLEKNETPFQGAIRELFEETSISIDPSKVQQIGSLYIRKPEIDYVYHLFRIKMDARQEVRLSPEHQSYRWVSAKEIETLPLMTGAKEAYAKYQILSAKKREGASVNAYLILKQQGNVLLHLRKNTGYCDGMWSLVAGHVENSESATEGMIREAYEEIGIQIRLSQLKVVHIMHRKTNRLNVDVFFECTAWEGTISNREPDKCERIEFFPMNALPLNTVDYNIFAVKAALRGEFYSELGWEQ